MPGLPGDCLVFEVKVYRGYPTYPGILRSGYQGLQSTPWYFGNSGTKVTKKYPGVWDMDTEVTEHTLVLFEFDTGVAKGARVT